ncbi:hypothetical protein G7Z17_g326 [Cylindrodendrum hubeiense]|uniref:CBM-cenC domain-containing protein n=1 Tax=Cylindrodendrum hubeiense TaxID=595255 RepID=A0A9P5HN32_9HYPO|nr:hypothetical protein G7Z17_g326 [Cylindrodendrum hubeiense]
MLSSLKVLAAVGLLALNVAAEKIEAPPENVMVDLNFNDHIVDDWYLQTIDSDYFMDITNAEWKDGSLDPALRVGEITGTKGTGQAIVKYKPSFDLELGEEYQIQFSARSSYVESSGKVVPAFGSNFGDWLQFTVFNQNGNIFVAWPGKGDYYEKEWYQWRYRFTVASGQDGPGYFGIIVHPTGTSVDWSFDDVSIIKVP